MSRTLAPKLTKWPFLVGDLLLVGLAAVFVFRSPTPMNVWQGLACVAATALGAWFCVLPFLREYQAQVTLREADALADSVTHMANLEAIKTQITSATAQWQSVQQHSSDTVAAAKEIAARIKADMGEFSSFLQKANDTEKNHLRLEVEKLRRGERDWLQATVHILDHVFALHAAAARSSQPGLAGQLAQFQFACRDAARRLGLVGFAPAASDPFDAQLHQLEDAKQACDGLQISEILALGYTYRGELVRKALVKASLTANHPELGPSDAETAAVESS